MTYILEKNENNKIVLKHENQEKPIFDVLRIFPEKRIYALRGKMGAGKTTFTKALCEALGTEDVVNSPTFAIVNVYNVGASQEEFYHFDCYRLKSLAEAMDFGAEEYLYSGNYCFIEWPEMIEELLPEDIVNIYIEAQHDGSRIVRVE